MALLLLGFSPGTCLSTKIQFAQLQVLAVRQAGVRDQRRDRQADGRTANKYNDYGHMGMAAIEK